jgi:hypothetical protein
MSTVRNTALVPALLEVAQMIGAAEAALTTPANNVQIGFDLETATATINGDLPVSIDSNATGVAINATDYAPVASFDISALTDLPGASSLTNASDALLRIATEINQAELIREAAGLTQPANAGVSVSVNFDTSRATLTASLPITVAIDSNGKSVITATNYLA